MNRRDFVSLCGKFGVCGVVAPVNCDDCNGPNGPKTTNEKPVARIEKQFQDDGKVKYTFSGTDKDGSIDYIKIRINNGSYTDVGDNSSRFVGIIQGTNNVSAIAYDNEGKDGDVVTSDFVSPTKDKAVEKMEWVLAQKNYNSLEKNVLISPGKWREFSVDYWVIKNDGTDAVIHYIGHENNLANELLNKKELDNYGVPNLYLARFPLSEIQSRVSDFANRGFK